jgi:hypothetical protein
MFMEFSFLLGVSSGHRPMRVIAVVSLRAALKRQEMVEKTVINRVAKICHDAHRFAMLFSCWLALMLELVCWRNKRSSITVQ